MSSEVTIYNLALSHLAVGVEVSATNERSPEAEACLAFYDIARDDTLRAFPWKFANKIDALDLVAEQPNSEWGYSYRYPSDCVHFRRILSGNRMDTVDSRIRYTLGQDTAGQLIYTDQATAEGEYTLRVTNVDRYPPDFKLALSYRLASLIAARVCGGDPRKLGTKAYQLYGIELSRAAANSGNEEQPDKQPESEFINARD